MRQIKQRIVFSYHLGKLDHSQIKTYVKRRLSVVSKNKIRFGLVASFLVSRYSRGIPRLVNILCHKALMLAFGQSKKTISARNIISAAKDTESVNTWVQDHIKLIVTLLALLTSSSAIALWGLS